MKFVSINYLWILWLIPMGVLFFGVSTVKRMKKLERIFARELWSTLLPDWRPWRRTLKMGFLFLSVIFLCLALLRPQWGYELREIKRKGVDIFVAIDTSDSMLSEDIKPNRMERARRELTDLLTFLNGDRVGLIAFAGISYVACPLTTDYEAFSLFIDELDTDLIPLQGTDISGAVSKAIDSFEPDAKRFKAILLLTDGEDTASGMEKAVKKARAAEVRLFIMGMGTPDGVPIPLRHENGFKKDASGNIVLSRLNETILQQAAQATGGSYVRSVTGDADLEQLYIKGIKQVLEAGELKSETKNVGKERFQFPLFLAVLLLLIEPFVSEVAFSEKNNFWLFWLFWRRFRRSKMVMIFLMLVLMGGKSAYAFSPFDYAQDMLFGFDTANREYDHEKYPQAEEGYRALLKNKSDDPKVYFNLGDTLYRQQKYGEAGDYFKKALNSKDIDLREKALYNLGNNLYRENKLQEAVDSYNKALEMKPDDKNAKANRDFVLEKLKQEQQKQDQQDQQQKEGQNGDQNQQEEQSPSQEEKSNKEQQQQKEGEQKDQKQEQGAGGETDRWLNSVEDNPKGAIKDILQREVGNKSSSGGKDW